MKFTAPKSIILEALVSTGKCIAAQSILPITNCYKFDIEGNALTITGTNMEVFLSRSIEIVGDGTNVCVAVPSVRLATLIKDLPEQEISFEFAELAFVTNLILKHKGGKYTIPCEKGEEFPTLPDPMDFSFSLPSQEMFIGIDKTMFACSADTSDRFGTLNLAIDDREITFTGADGTLIGTKTFELVEPISKKSLLVPTKSLSILRGIACADLITVFVSDRNLKFILNETTVLYTMLFDGTYPNAKAVLPIDNTKIVLSDTKSILGGIKRVANFCNPNENALTFSFSENLVKIGLDNMYGESANEEIEIEYSQDPFEIKLNSTQLIKILTRIDGDKVELRLEDNRHGVIVNEIDANIASRSNLMLTSPYLK